MSWSLKRARWPERIKPSCHSRTLVLLFIAQLDWYFGHFCTASTKQDSACELVSAHSVLPHTNYINIFSQSRIVQRPHFDSNLLRIPPAAHECFGPVLAVWWEFKSRALPTMGKGFQCSEAPQTTGGGLSRYQGNSGNIITYYERNNTLVHTVAANYCLQCKHLREGV